MKKLILAASALALLPTAAHAQLLGGGGLGGGLGGTLGGTLRGELPATIDSTTRSVRGTADSTVSGSGTTSGSQSVDRRTGTVKAERSAEGSITGSTASLAELVVPQMGGMTGANGSGSASGQGSATAQLIGTDAVGGTLAPVASGAKGLAADTTGTALGAAGEMIESAPMTGMPMNPVTGMANGDGRGAVSGAGTASLLQPTLAAAGSAAAAGQGMASVMPGMTVMTSDGASLGKVHSLVANSRGEVEQVIVKQGKVTRTLPAGMFTASGDALIAGEAQGAASSASPEPAPAEGTASH